MGCARTLFIRVFQLWQLPLHCRSSAACTTPSPLPSQFPHFFHWDLAFLSVMYYQWGCRRCLGLPNHLPLPLLLLTPPLLTVSVYLLPLPQSSVSTSLFMVHSVFFPGFLFSTWLIWVSLLILHFSTSFLVWLPSNLIFLSFVSLSLTDVRKATMDYGVTSLSPRQMLSCQIQVRSLFHFYIL